MADRFPLILNTSTNQIQEIPSGDNLDLTGTGINNAGIITAGNVTIGAATTDLVVNGDARITGILTIGTSSLKLDGPNNLVNVGTALTLGHTQGLQFHTQNLHSAGFEVNQVNASGIITATGADINGDLDVDGHTNLDNVSIAGVVTATTGVFIPDDNSLKFGNNSGSPDLKIEHVTASTFNRLHATNGYMQYRASAHFFNNEASSINFIRLENNRVDLRYNGSQKLTTETSGVNITGVCTATTFSGSGASLTNLNGSNIASGTVPVARIGTGTKNTSTFYRGDGTFATVTPPAITAINNATNNRVVTSEGGTTVNAESNLTFDGTNLECAGTITASNRIIGPGSNGNSTLIKSGATGAAALTLQDSGGTHRLELYGEGGYQGFLASVWGAWDLKKQVDGQLTLRVGGGNYLAIHQNNVSGNVGLQSIVEFTSVGTHTWSKPSGITRIKVYVTGGGGGGGSHNSDDANGGGGAGGTAIEIIDVTSVSSVSVTVGGGGNGSSGNSPSNAGDGSASSFGSYCTGGGGAGPNNWGIGGDGGTASGGDLNLRGGNGTAGNIDGYSNSEAGGSGGASFWGGGPSGGTHWESRTGNGAPGAGGAGTHASTNNSGSNGLSGIVVVEQYKS